MKISLCVVACDEAARLEECLRDARPHVDEIVVVVQESKDDTREVANRLADVVVDDECYGYCEASRRLCHSRAHGDWMLVLDCDEVMSDRFKAEMRGLTENHHVLGYRLMRQLWMDGEMVFQGDTQYRFFRKDMVRFLNEIHTEPQPLSSAASTEYPAIIHRKTMAEQLGDEARCERVLTDSKHNFGGTSPSERQYKLALNVHNREVTELTHVLREGK